jgi:predicted hotdog family 3-hydroxylacyl-ACP dehydratase
MADLMHDPACVFPMETRKLLPHEGAMHCIDRLLFASKTTAVAETDLAPGHNLLAGQTLDPVGYVELAAQTAGAMQGYDQYLQNLPLKFGFLVGVQDFLVFDLAELGDTVRMEVAIVAELGEVTVLSAQVFRNDQILAEGKLKVFVPV